MIICSLCGSKNIKSFLSFQASTYNRCNNCSFVFLDKNISFPEEEKLYSGDYIRERGHDRPDSSLWKAKEATAHQYLSLLEKHISKGNLLDIGCSTGITLKVARDRGWSVYGVEVNESAAAFAREVLNIGNVKIGRLSNEMFPDEFFSAVLMFDVIEHIHPPLEFIQILRNKIKPSGLLLIITPNIDSISAKLLKTKWPHLFPEHVCLYSPKSIRFLLEKHGFSVLKTGWAKKFATIDMIRRHLECHSNVLLSKPLLTLLNALTVFEHVVFPLNIGEMFVLARKL
jgi:2-polyprenyl-3-methyl-5-hydroxy-6-metoxy-1,4-benzoquinol methylase